MQHLIKNASNAQKTKCNFLLIQNFPTALMCHIYWRKVQIHKKQVLLCFKCNNNGFYFMFGLAISSVIEFKTKAIMKQPETIIIFVYTQKDFALKCIWHNYDQNNPPIFTSALNHQSTQGNVHIYYIKHHELVEQLANLIFFAGSSISCVYRGRPTDDRLFW